jgi:hypothetical protein
LGVGGTVRSRSLEFSVFCDRMEKRRDSPFSETRPEEDEADGDLTRTVSETLCSTKVMLRGCSGV